LKLKIFQVLHGDSLLIRYLGDDENSHNIFIDGGFVSTYARTVKKATKEIIEKNEKIDLFVITHIDYDHIGGVLSFIREYGKQNIVNEYWFNCGKLHIDLSDNGKISYSQGLELRDYLSENEQIKTDSIHGGLNPFNFFGAKITILSPLSKDIKEFQEKWVAQEKKLISAKQNDYHLKIEDLANNSFHEDNRIENKVSISFLFEYHDKSILFLADSHPSVIVNSLKKKGYSKEKKLNVDYVKLSHHASKFNTSFELLEVIDCTNFIISANAKNSHYLPHKETLARVLKHPERKYEQQVNFIFNYDNAELRSIFESSDFSAYNFNCLYPGTNENGYTIEL